MIREKLDDLIAKAESNTRFTGEKDLILEIQSRFNECEDIDDEKELQILRQMVNEYREYAADENNIKENPSLCTAHQFNANYIATHFIHPAPEKPKK